ncbi:MAG: V-type ATPase subunit [Candidatus Thermoplasmatota archaeon]|nr:V-type ATPase subunit [Candidatus Thermoplasmatota archaeon]
MSPIGLSGLVYPAIAAGGALAVSGAAFGVKYMIRLGQFSYQNARLSTIGNPYITREQLMQLVEFGDADALSRSLQGSFSFNSPPRSFRDADHRLMDSFAKVIDELVKDSPSPTHPSIALLLLRYESMELKRLLRSVGSSDGPIHPIGSLRPDLEMQVLRSGGLSQAVECLEHHPLGKDISSLTRSGDVDLSSLDMALDRAVIGYMRRVEGVPKIAKKGTIDLGDTLADAYNINMMLRLKGGSTDREKAMTFVVPGGTIRPDRIEGMAEATTVHEAVQVLSGTTAEEHLKRSEVSGTINMDVAMDRMVLDGAVRIGQRYFSGIGPTIRHVISLEMEMRNLRTLFLASFYGWERERTISNLVLQEESV